jgi:ubiquitin-conjugating enzyme E2 D/E
MDWCTVEPVNDDIMNWRATLSGPEDSVYAGGSFSVDFVFPPTYPFKPPSIRFLTKIYHCNVKTETGEICADVVDENWAPTLNVKHCLVTLRSMMLEPNIDSPLEQEIASQLRDDPKEFERVAQEWVTRYATA